jgi:hypothetical protein
MVLWTSAETIGQANLSNVISWGDQSGRGNTLGNPVFDAGGTITYATGESNGLPAVRFFNDSALRTNGLLANGQSGEMFFVLRTPSVVSGVQHGGFHRTGTDSNQHMSWSDVNVYENFATNNRQNALYPSGVGTASQYNLYNVYGRDNGGLVAGDPAWAASLNGTIFMSKATNGGTSYFAGANAWEFGRSAHIGDTWEGHIAEIVVTNRALNQAERMIVENHLHSKYNLPSALEAGTDHYSGDTLANGNYDSDVIGVGRVNASNISPAAGAAGFGIEATSGLDDGEFIMAGHKVPTNALTTSGLAGNIAGERWSREWFVDSAGDNVNLQLAFDWANDGFASTDGSDTYQLLWKPNEGGLYTILSQGTIAGSNALFNVNSTQIGNGIVTLGINVSLIPVPTTLVMWLGLGLCGLVVARRQYAKSRR